MAPPRSTPAGFWTHVSVVGSCWEWQGARQNDRGGYGVVKWHGRMWRAHRLAYELTFGPLPADLFVLHVCDNPPCCRPDHLRLGTQADNIGDAVRKGRMATGDRNASRLYPERRARGERHGSHTHPERWTNRAPQRPRRKACGTPEEILS